MDNSLEYQTVILSALLHDIGKFLQRGKNLPFKIEGTHPEVYGQFISAFADIFKPVADVDLLRTLVTHHHQNKIMEIKDDRTRNLAYLVNKADVLSSNERGEDARGDQDYKTTPLMPVFQRIFASPDTNTLLRYHPFFLAEPGILSEKSMFPANFQEYTSTELKDTIDAFDKAFGTPVNTIFKTMNNDFNAFSSHILALLQSYTLAIPANTQETIPDTSLFDHLKTTAAIAACLYQTYQARNEWEAAKREDNAQLFFLTIGDVSGIQRYVFDITEKDRTGGGVARRLRARSFFVQLISEVAPLQILEKFELPLTNILMASGGKYYILLPKLPDTGKRLEEYRQDSEKWFLNSFKGALGLNLAWVPCNESSLGKGFGETLKQVMSALEIKKEQGFRDYFVADNKWNTSAFVLPPFDKNERACRSCGKFSAPESDFCHQCLCDLDWGRTLPNADLIKIDLNVNGDGREILGAKVDIGGFNTLSKDTSLALHINNPDIHQFIKHPASFRYLARYIPHDNDGKVMDFQKIAKKSHGRHYLGFLKADVDNMGGIFAFGLRGKEGDEQWDTLSRIATMSRQLDLFFTGWVEHLLETEDFKECYCVFSGGDDLFVIGPWNQALDFVTRLREDFTKYTCNNAKVTLSAGIVIENPSYPVGQAADEAGDAVDKSKEKRLEDEQEKRGNRLTLLGHTLTWEEWAGVEKLWKNLRGEEKTSSAFLYNLLDYGRMWQEYSKWVKTNGKEGSVLGLRFQPLLAYNIKRNLNRRENQQVYDWADKLLEWRPNTGNKEIERTLENLSLIAQLLILWKEESNDTETV